MLTKKQIEKNKNEFITLLKGIKRKDARIDDLIKKLLNSDFFIAPASIKYHGNYEGGLCQHSLNVYYNLIKLVEVYKDSNIDEECFNENSLKIVSLLHDISKMNIYEKSPRNVKKYCEDGDKEDEFGKFKWVVEVGYKLKDEIFTYGSHEMNSEFIIRQYIPLTIVESVSILHHMGGMHWDSAKDNLSGVFNSYSLALLLHLSDMTSTYIDERVINESNN